MRSHYSMGVSFARGNTRGKMQGVIEGVKGAHTKINKGFARSMLSLAEHRISALKGYQPSKPVYFVWYPKRKEGILTTA